MIGIRPAAEKDIKILADVERSAAEAFLTLSEYIPSDRTVPSDLLMQMMTNKNLWVATVDESEPVGFIGCMDMNNLLYVHEISVAHKFQKQGIGRRLMLHIIDGASRANYPAVGLTTRRDAVWNMPFYKTLGFIETTESQKWPGLFAQLQKEIDNGADSAIRCAMVKILKGT